MQGPQKRIKTFDQKYTCKDIKVCIHNRVVNLCAECQIAAMKWCMKTGGPKIDVDIEEFVLDRLAWAPVRDSFIMSVDHGCEKVCSAEFFKAHGVFEDRKVVDFLIVFEGTEEEYAGFLVGLCHFHGPRIPKYFFEDERRDSFYFQRLGWHGVQTEGVKTLKMIAEEFPYVLSIRKRTPPFAPFWYGVNDKEEFLSGFSRALFYMFPYDIFYTSEKANLLHKRAEKSFLTLRWREKDGVLTIPEKIPLEIFKKCIVRVLPLGECCKTIYTKPFKPHVCKPPEKVNV